MFLSHIDVSVSLCPPFSLKSTNRENSSHDGSIGKHGSPPHTRASKQKITERPSFRIVRNQVEWKSDNYIIKETAFIQTARRAGDTEWTHTFTCPTCACGGQKFGRIILGVRSPSPTSGPPAQGSSARKVSPPQHLAAKTSRD